MGIQFNANIRPEHVRGGRLRERKSGAIILSNGDERMKELEGFTVISAVGVLRHTGDQLPSAEEVAELLNSGTEKIVYFLRRLTDDGILVEVTTPFGVRYDIGDLDKLPDFKPEKTPSVEEHVEEMKKRREEQEKKIKDWLASGGKDKSDKFSDIEQKLKDPTKVKKPSPLDDLFKKKE